MSAEFFTQMMAVFARAKTAQCKRHMPVSFMDETLNQDLKRYTDELSRLYSLPDVSYLVHFPMLWSSWMGFALMLAQTVPDNQAFIGSLVEMTPVVQDHLLVYMEMCKRLRLRGRFIQALDMARKGILVGEQHALDTKILRDLVEDYTRKPRDEKEAVSMAFNRKIYPRMGVDAEGLIFYLDREEDLRDPIHIWFEGYILKVRYKHEGPVFLF